MNIYIASAILLSVLFFVIPPSVLVYMHGGIKHVAFFWLFITFVLLLAVIVSWLISEGLNV